MKKRNPITVFLLSVITLGIYDLYWLVKTKSVLNEKTRFHTPTIWLLFSPLALLIAGYIAIFASAASTHTVTTGTGTIQSTNAALNIFAIAAILIGGISFFLISFIWFFKFSKAINAYTHGKMSTGVSFLILYVIHLIGVAIIQDTFNDMIDAGQDGGHLQPQPVAIGPSGEYTAPPSSFTPAPMASTDEPHLSTGQGQNQAGVSSNPPGGNYQASVVAENPPVQGSVAPPANESQLAVLPPNPSPPVEDTHQHQP